MSETVQQYLRGEPFSCEPIMVVDEGKHVIEPHADGLCAVTLWTLKRDAWKPKELFVAKREYAERMVAAMNTAHAEQLVYDKGRAKLAKATP